MFAAMLSELTHSAREVARQLPVVPNKWTHYQTHWSYAFSVGPV